MFLSAATSRVGPLLLHDVHLVDTLAHFNRENVPERRLHATGVAHTPVFLMVCPKVLLGELRVSAGNRWVVV